MTVLAIPAIPIDSIVTVEQRLRLSEGDKYGSGILRFKFPALCSNHGGVPVSYKTGGSYPYDALLSSEVTIICGECGHVSIVQIERRV